MRWVLLQAITLCQRGCPRRYTKLHDSDDLLVLAVICVLKLANEAM
jgi:hypothetical protein